MPERIKKPAWDDEVDYGSTEYYRYQDVVHAHDAQERVIRDRAERFAIEHLRAIPVGQRLNPEDQAAVAHDCLNLSRMIETYYIPWDDPEEDE